VSYSEIALLLVNMLNNLLTHDYIKLLFRVVPGKDIGLYEGYVRKLSSGLLNCPT